MDIVFNCNDAYVPWLGAAAASLLSNSKEPEKVRLFVLTTGLSDENSRKLRELAASFGSGLLVVSVPSFEEELLSRSGSLPATGRFGLTALLRLFAPDYLPEDVFRYLYLDCDLIVRKDLSPLFETELCGAPAALAPEPTIYGGVKDYLGMPEEAPYFNSGVILTDRKRWQELSVSEACLAYLGEKSGRLPFADQDVLNHVLSGRAAVLSQRWNFLSNYYYRSYESLIKGADWYRSICKKKDYRAAREDPAIVHFAGAERPWIRGNRNPYRMEFRKYLELTAWKDTPEIPERELSMAMYHAMNVLTGLCPPLRRGISALYFRRYMAAFQKSGEQKP